MHEFSESLAQEFITNIHNIFCAHTQMVFSKLPRDQRFVSYYENFFQRNGGGMTLAIHYTTRCKQNAISILWRETDTNSASGKTPPYLLLIKLLIASVRNFKRLTWFFCLFRIQVTIRLFLHTLCHHPKNVSYILTAQFRLQAPH